jgi:ATP-dependent DNA helicase RecQ
LLLTEADKNTRILRILSRVKGSGLIYVRNRKKTEELSRFLSKSGFKVDFYHAGLSNEIRSRKLIQWKENEISVMVCTNAFGMGIDKPDVRLVIHYEIPDSLESYYQEAGRAGRDGLDSYCVLLWQPSDGVEASDRQLQQFPSSAQVEQVYQSLGNYYNLGINAGAGTDHAFDIGNFCDKFRLRPSIVISALKLLHKHDLISMNQGVEKPSKIKIICSHTELYDFQIRNPNLDPFIKLILRTCGGGVFADYTTLEESLLGKRAGISTREVFTLLKRLQQLNILDFVPRNEDPLITFLCDRMSKTGITRMQLEENKERAMDRLHSLIRFCEDEAECRSKILLRYFDEEDTQMCGNCDVCRKLNREKINEEDWKSGVLNLTKFLEMGPRSMEEIIAASGVKKEKLMSTIVRMLMDEEKLTLDENHKITWHERR